jgi:hypothetical protein
MKIKLFASFTVILGLFAFVFCLGNYKKTPLNLNASKAPFERSEAGVTVSYKAYTPRESKASLNRDLLSRGYQPVQVTIQNNTSHTYSVSPRDVSLPLAGPANVAMSITKEAIPRSIAYKVAGFFFWPLIIPGTIDSIHTFQTHSNLKRDFAVKSLKRETVPPYATIHRILFVPLKSYQDDFSLVLRNTSNDIPIQFNS